MASFIQAVDRALLVLETIADAQSPLNLSELSAQTGLHVSTAHRLLATLHERGFIERDQNSSRYRIGLRAFRVGSSYDPDNDLRVRLKPMLALLAEQSGETTNLVIRDGLQAVYIDNVVGTKVMKLITRIGERVPLYCTAVGKALLAFAEDNEAYTISNLKLTRFTSHTLTSRRALTRELCRIRDKGIAVDREEHELGVGCIASPIKGPSGNVVAVLGISGPSGRVLKSLPELSKLVRSCAQAASGISSAAFNKVSA